MAKLKINEENVNKKCDKCCDTCSRVKDRGTWLQCTVDSKEVQPNYYCSYYRG